MGASWLGALCWHCVGAAVVAVETVAEVRADSVDMSRQFCCCCCCCWKRPLRGDGGAAAKVVFGEWPPPVATDESADGSALRSSRPEREKADAPLLPRRCAALPPPTVWRWPAVGSGNGTLRYEGLGTAAAEAEAAMMGDGAAETEHEDAGRVEGAALAAAAPPPTVAVVTTAEGAMRRLVGTKSSTALPGSGGAAAAALSLGIKTATGLAFEFVFVLFVEGRVGSAEPVALAAATEDEDARC